MEWTHDVLDELKQRADPEADAGAETVEGGTREERLEALLGGDDAADAATEEGTP